MQIHMWNQRKYDKLDIIWIISTTGSCEWLKNIVSDYCEFCNGSYIVYNSNINWNARARQPRNSIKDHDIQSMYEQDVNSEIWINEVQMRV